jgi:hypothetical protein
MKRAPMRRASPKRITSEDADPAYLAQVRRLPCCASHLSECQGRIHAHHQTHDRAKGTKAHDHKSFAFCMKHHAEFHAASNVFASWDQAKRREWQDRMVACTQRLLLGIEMKGIL